MSLYQLPLPPLELLPVTIPEHIHPLLVHLAIALPIIILIVELFNIVAKKRSIAVLSLFFMLLLGVSIFGAIATGITDAKLAHAAGEVKEIILEHKAIGTFMLYGVGFLVILKLLSMFVSKNLFKLGYVLFMFIFIAATFYEGKLGGSLVYKHAVNVNISTNSTTIEVVQEPVKEDEHKEETTKPKEHSPETTQEHKEINIEIKTQEQNSSAIKEESTHDKEVTIEKKEKSQTEASENNTTKDHSVNEETNMHTNDKTQEHNQTVVTHD